MTVRTEAWALTEDWNGPREIAEATGRRRASVSREMMRMVSEGLLERRFIDGRGDEFRRKPGAVPPEDTASMTRESALALLAGGPKTVREIAESLGAPTGTVQMSLQRMGEAGLAERVPGTQPTLWRLAR